MESAAWTNQNYCSHFHIRDSSSPRCVYSGFWCPKNPNLLTRIFSMHARWRCWALNVNLSHFFQGEIKTTDRISVIRIFRHRGVSIQGFWGSKNSNLLTRNFSDTCQGTLLSSSPVCCIILINMVEIVNVNDTSGGFRVRWIHFRYEYRSNIHRQQIRIICTPDTSMSMRRKILITEMRIIVLIGPGRGSPSRSSDMVTCDFFDNSISNLCIHCINDHDLRDAQQTHTQDYLK